MKTCISCKHYEGATQVYAMHMQHGAEPQCKHPEAASRDMVNGVCYCRQERNNKKGCGAAGKLWEQNGTAKGS